MLINSIVFRGLYQTSVFNSLKCLQIHLKFPSKEVVCHYSNEVTVTLAPLPKSKGISNAMKAYLERAQQHDEFMKTKNEEYQVGKRHLANMMGEDPETFTQENVDNAIEYLFPSGLFDKRARPLMKPPDEMFPVRKSAEFDESGRPFHSMFYTTTPNFYKLLYDIAEHIIQLNKFEDVMIQKNVKADPELQLDASIVTWISKDKLEQVLVENLIEIEYQKFVAAMNRLLALPYSYRIKDFLMQYQKPYEPLLNTTEIAKPKYDEDGRMYVTVYECARKTARGDVTIRSPGSGKISINGQDISIFKDAQPREQVLFPLIFTGMLGKVDVEANITGGGPSGMAGCIRYGTSMALRSFVDVDTVERMRLAGLLQRDYRRRERKKPGQAGARKKFTWKKR